MKTYYEYIIQVRSQSGEWIHATSFGTSSGCTYDAVIADYRKTYGENVRILRRKIITGEWEDVNENICRA